MGNTATTRRRREAQQRANNGLNGSTFVQPAYQQPLPPHQAPGHYPGPPPQYHIPPSHPGVGLGPHAHQYYPQVPPGYYPAQTRPQAPLKNSAVHNTSTVRNLVNLKKPTLTVTPVEGRPHLLRVSFKFDAVSACCVSVFPMAHEEGRDGKVVSKSTVGKRVAYEKGWNLVFPPEDLEDPDLYCIDTQAYQAEQLQHANMTTSSYPLIIRLETLGEASDAPEGTQLADLELGCAQPSWLQSQTTYVVLGEEGSQLVAKVIKQKIWVGGSSYELQEIYGLSMEASSSGGGDGDTSTECVVCLTNPKNTTVIPCRHFCMCSDCAKALLNQSRKCPMCRLNITSVLQINIGASSRAPAAAAR